MVQAETLFYKYFLFSDYVSVRTEGKCYMYKLSPDSYDTNVELLYDVEVPAHGEGRFQSIGIR